jgi:hypothetical protein
LIASGETYLQPTETAKSATSKTHPQSCSRAQVRRQPAGLDVTAQVTCVRQEECIEPRVIEALADVTTRREDNTLLCAKEARQLLDVFSLTSTGEIRWPCSANEVKGPLKRPD